jgi:hypothetical protein
VRRHWLNALAATVKPFTGGTQIRHSVMAITGVADRPDGAILSASGQSSSSCDWTAGSP